MKQMLESGVQRTKERCRMGQDLRWKPRATMLVFVFRHLSVREAVPHSCFVLVHTAVS